MNIDWLNFSPLEALIGGALIGTAAAALWLFNGRIAGISGIVGGLLANKIGDRAWRLAFLAGLIGSPLAYQHFAPLPTAQIDASVPMLLGAGFLVGLGTRYGSGCTSGHGICGMSRLSPRSIVATLSFMASAFITVYITKHILNG